ncbi:MAG TPA: superoxide dismutase [Anaerolineaceae bacterium]|jgi:superoxide dismutase, Fe-Mn family
MYELPPLQYAFNALEPAIDAMTMEIHHDKHHATYVNSLNKALESHPELQNRPIDALLKGINTLPDSVRTAVRNHGGGHANHTLFWDLLAPGGSKAPGGALSGAITSSFGTFEDFQKTFSDSATGRFGSGWAWLALDNKGKLLLYSTANQDSPIMEGHTPILGLDVWEHAYYLKYQNRRADYIKAWWSVVNWDAVAKKYSAAK